MHILPRGVLVFAVCVGVAGCGSTWSTSNVQKSGYDPKVNASVTAPVRAPTPAAEILVTEGDITDRKYRVLGDINVNVNKTTIFNADPTRADVDAKLREEAYKLRADAVVLVRYGSVGIGLMSWGSLDGKGRAVVYED